MNTTERERMRAALDRASAAGFLPEAAAPHPGRFVQAADTVAPAVLIERFAHELESLAGHVHRAPDVEAAVAIVKRIADDHGARSFLAWSDDDLVREASSSLERDGIVQKPQNVALAGPERVSSLAEIESCALGITGADFGLADTGSVVLGCGPGRGRLASLLPPVHVVMIRLERIVASLAHALAADPTLTSRGSNLVVITGPSRTADIEFTLSRGVHGPREIHVVVVG